MKKLQHPRGFILTGTDNNGFRHRYSVRKNEQFKKIFVKFMVDLDFDEKWMESLFQKNDVDDNLIELKISEFEFNANILTITVKRPFPKKEEGEEEEEDEE